MCQCTKRLMFKGLADIQQRYVKVLHSMAKKSMYIFLKPANFRAEVLT